MVRHLFWVEDLLSSNLSNQRIIIIRKQINKYKYLILIIISNVIDIEIILFILQKCSISKYIKKLLGIPCYILKRI